MPAKKKRTVKRSAPKKAAVAKSFKIGKDSSDFMSFRITDQTIYWSILFIYILALSLWVLNIQIDTLRILDSIQSV